MTKLPERLFETERVYVRPFKTSDLDALAAIMADPMVTRYVDDGSTMTRVEVATWIEATRSRVASLGSGIGGVVLRDTTELIGWAGIVRPERAPVEIIYGLGRSYWGQGLGREVGLRLAQWAEAVLSDRVEATVDRRNTASKRILANAGFVCVEHTTYPSGEVIERFVRTPT